MEKGHGNWHAEFEEPVYVSVTNSVLAGVVTTRGDSVGLAGSVRVELLLVSILWFERDTG
jgi:hypothetical protein